MIPAPFRPRSPIDDATRDKLRTIRYAPNQDQVFADAAAAVAAMPDGDAIMALARKLQAEKNA